jgi:excisionase family DNA binding protein
MGRRFTFTYHVSWIGRLESARMTILTIDEAAAFLKVKKRTVYRHPEIPRVKVGGQLRFIQEDLERWLRSQAGGLEAPILDNGVPAVHHRSPILAMRPR